MAAASPSLMERPSAMLLYVKLIRAPRTEGIQELSRLGRKDMGIWTAPNRAAQCQKVLKHEPSSSDWLLQSVLAIALHRGGAEHPHPHQHPHQHLHQGIAWRAAACLPGPSRVAKAYSGREQLGGREGATARAGLARAATYCSEKVEVMV